MTLQGAIQELYEMREDTSLPVYYALSLADVINTLQTDVAEVRHGHWVYEKGDCFPLCSVCGQHHGTLYEYWYCPVCGALMDGDVEYA